MDVRELRAVVGVVMVGLLGMVVGQSSGSPTSFKDCYAKCFVFCMIEPSQTLCSCTTGCLKDCIFNSAAAAHIPDGHAAAAASSSYNFCKLGCAFSTCSSISTKHQPSDYSTDSERSPRGWDSSIFEMNTTLYGRRCLLNQEEYKNV
ncbi:hypothetical protein DM860_010092 [Cuscuta australis]|uniref:Thionin-like protein 2 n=1 Tax=Cuscuta australis TaxID=267555 RepID=A0A328DA26_9ASTE|nr:hypothetical protein DM860_010092 [Cuscuta australis]